MKIFSNLFKFLFFLTVSVQVHAICQIPDNLDLPSNNKARFECLKNSYFLQEPITNITPDMAYAGPEIDEEVKFSPQEEVYCRYFYRPQNGASNKFRCYRTDKNNVLMNEKGQVVPEAVRVGSFGTEDEDILFNSQGQMILTKKGKPMKADALKVRFQDGGRRHRENYTSTAASRMSWIMGIPSEHSFAVKKLVCFGCQKNPWNEGKAPQPAYIEGLKNEFPYAAIERKHEAKRVMKALQVNGVSTFSPWTWADFFSKKSQLSEEQVIGLEVLALAANLFQTIENRGSQHMILCEKEINGIKNYNKDQKTCLKTLPAVHDIGSAFGSRLLYDKKANNNHPRGDYKYYAQTPMFKDLNRCILGSVPAEIKGQPGTGMTSVSQKGQQAFLKRAELLTPEVIYAVLEASYFQYVDLEFYAETQQKTKLKGSQLDQYVLNEWTNLITKKLEEFKIARCQ